MWGGCMYYYYCCLCLLIKAPGARPVVKPLLEEGEKLDFIENYFTVPVSVWQWGIPLGCC